ncbi:MAG: hypothetical protein JXA64_01475 [Candidatus Fermentibacteraceae bacterium]|nr:hypothetical protein [Candidatus Fermentibacteraceae bacterium]MBN2607757.1 hypothetical protein [Candidatus Fermentibacteraceae bacterium]
MRLALFALLSAVLFLSSVCPAQKAQGNVRDIYESGISLDLGGVVFGGASFDTYISNKLNLELSLGVIFGAGLNYHFIGDDPDTRWSPYIGVHGGLIPDLELNLFGDDSDEPTVRPNVYLPAGVHYISGSGFSLALELGYMHAFENDDANSFDIPWFGCKIGFRL